MLAEGANIAEPLACILRACKTARCACRGGRLPRLALTVVPAAGSAVPAAAPVSEGLKDIETYSGR